MLRIWGRANSSAVAKVMWTVAELGLPHQRIDIGGDFGGTTEPAYLALNPNARIPTIEDGDFVLWESNAIVRYLAAKYSNGDLWPADLRRRANADRWMDWSTTTLADPIDRLRKTYRKLPPEKIDAEAVTAALARASAVVGIFDRVLQTSPYAAGDEFTAADIALGPLLHRWTLVPFDKPDFVGVARWYAQMSGRPAFKAVSENVR